MNAAMQRIAVFGLGKVGITLAGCLLRAGKTVVGVDVVEPIVRTVNDRAVVTSEPGVLERIAPAWDRFRATTDPLSAVRSTEAAFVIVPTSSNALGGFSNAHILETVRAIGSALAQCTHPYTVSVVSTVMPGSSESQIIPALEQSSGRRIGPSLGYCYNPSFIAQGEIVKGIEQPSYVLIGEADRRSGDVISAIHQSMLVNEVPAARMTPVEAEVTKLASNTYETMRVTFANMLLSICSETPNANVDAITNALSHRMGKKFFRGAVPYGGPCWPRDNIALSAFMETINIPSMLPRTIDICNREHGLYVLRRILRECPRGSKVGVVGLAYKPGTPLIDRAFSIDLCRHLRDEGRVVKAWDPMAADTARAVLPADVEIVAAASDLADCDALVLTLPFPELMEFDWAHFSDKVVIDCWRALDPGTAHTLRQYVPLGITAAASAPRNPARDALFSQLTE